MKGEPIKWCECRHDYESHTEEKCRYCTCSRFVESRPSPPIDADLVEAESRAMLHAREPFVEIARLSRLVGEQGRTRDVFALRADLLDKALTEANRRLAANNLEPVPVPCLNWDTLKLKFEWGKS